MKFSTISWVDGEIEILDQTLLPGKECYVRLQSYRDVVEAIKSLRVRGAPLIGITAAYGVVLSSLQAGNKVEFALAINEIKSSRPTAVNLVWAVERMLITYHAYADTPERDQKLLELARQIHTEDEQMCDAIGRRGLELLPSGAAILTHCNTGALATGGCGTAAGIIYHAHWAGKRPVVFADETRPVLQGSRLTAWELAREGIDVTIVTDSQAAFLMSRGRVDCVIVGADRIASNYDVANKIGTYNLAVLAKHHGIPFYVAAPSSTFDNQLSSGNDIPIERRDPNEVIYVAGRRIAPENAVALNYAFDVTPNELISAIITEQELIECGRWRDDS
jgi:methylthioribose-1-phosphate isomerase